MSAIFPQMPTHALMAIAVELIELDGFRRAQCGVDAHRDLHERDFQMSVPD